MDPLFIILIGTATVLLCIIRLKLHAALSLLLAALVTALLTTPEQLIAFAEHQGMGDKEVYNLVNMTVGKRLAMAFGSTSGKIGILIALASVIGTALMRSGGAERIIRALLKLFGKKNTSVALLSGSFTLAIPVFFDTVFYLMVPLVKSVGVRNPKQFGLYLMTIIAGGVMAHSLIPPTPGPLFVAEELGIDLGAMIIGGFVVGAFTVICGYGYAVWANSRWNLPMRDTPDITIEDLKHFSEKKEEELPALWLSLLPIALPIVLITGNTFSQLWSNPGVLQTTSQEPHIGKVLTTLGDANIALFLSSIMAMYLLWKRLNSLELFKKFIVEALSAAAMIILITSAGGAFGQMLQQTGIGIRVAALAADYQMAILPLAFLITAAVRTAQGSATVAMVTAIGVMSGLAQADLDFHPVYLALAIGCGSKIFAWMNDSAFWIITKMSGMEEKETIKYFSFLLMTMGFSGLIAVMILSKLLPFT